MAVKQARWIALLWLFGMGSLALSLWASAVLVAGAITWQESVWAVLFGSPSWPSARSSSSGVPAPWSAGSAS